MFRSHGFCRVLVVGSTVTALGLEPVAAALQPGRIEMTSEDTGDAYLVGSLAPDAKVTESDTFWIADWSFDGAGGGCTDAGWTRHDNRILNDGSNYWAVDSRLDGTGGIVGKAAILSKHDLAWARDGYGNNWDYSIILEYLGTATLSFDLLSDSEPGYDLVTIEADSAGASESRVDYVTDPMAKPEQYRVVLLSVFGVQNSAVGPLALPNYGAPAAIHQVYIRFVSDGIESDEDGLYTTVLNAGLVVDNIVVTGGASYSEDFEGALDPHVQFANTAVATPFGEWARVYQHITDNDYCTENSTCAWLWTDPTLPAYFPDMAFAPGGTVLRNWLDDVIVSPWVNLAAAPYSGALLSYGSFMGNSFTQSRLALNWSVRSRVRIDNTDTSALGDSIDFVQPWGHVHNFSTMGIFHWVTRVDDMAPWIDPAAADIQVRFRVVDRQYSAGSGPPLTLNTGPGPFIDRVRIGQLVLTGPLLTEGADSRSQAQDCFATVQNSIAPGQHHSPSTDRFGSCALSRGGDIDTIRWNLITGDSISIQARDVRGAGGVTAVRFHGAIVAGPHAGKAPAPYAVGANGFFEAVPDSVRSASGTVLADNWFVDLDDTYFRGGDRLLYFWSATDVAGGYASDPAGLVGPPASLADAEAGTGGLLEVSFLPTLDWDSAYLARIAADPHGDLDPTPAEIAGSSQPHCILYVQQHATRRRSGDANRTAFMYTLDRLGYRDRYDVYDVQGYGNTNNQIGGRATIEQCSGYAIIVQDNGRGPWPNLPSGGDPDGEKIDQLQWFQDYLDQGPASTAGIASLWLLGEDVAFEKRGSLLLQDDFGLGTTVDNQSLSLDPDVAGQVDFEFTTGNVGSFSDDLFALSGRCNALSDIGILGSSDYDGAAATGTAVVTHRYSSGGTPGLGAIIMNKNSALHWNTIWMGFGWFDIHDAPGDPPAGETPPLTLARTILGAVLPASCVQGEGPTDSGDDPRVDALPQATALLPNVPNPFNPTTTIRFDLAVDGRVELRIYDVGGRLVKTMVSGDRPRGRHTVVWHGADDAGTPVASGVYLCRFDGPDASAVRKLLLVR